MKKKSATAAAAATENTRKWYFCVSCANFCAEREDAAQCNRMMKRNE